MSGISTIPTADSATLRIGGLRLVQTLRSHGHVAWFAGGCVRDRLLGREPKDYDIATDATPDEVAALFARTQMVGAHFGVVLVKEAEGPYEVATFRRDGNYVDGRRPEGVEFSSAEEDAQRRDFTVNGLFEDPVEDRIIDYVGGQEDLKRKVLRAIGEPRRRFEEDHLRLLRAVRFGTVLGFEIEAETMAAIQAEATSIQKISPERIRDELCKTLLDANRQRGFDLLVETGLMAEILPEVLELQGCDQPPQWHPEGDVFTHTRIMLGLLGQKVTLPLVLSVLFHDIAKPPTQTYDLEDRRIRFNGHDKLGAHMAEDILRRLRFSNEIIEATSEMVANHMNFKDVKKMRTAKLKRFMARPHFEDEIELHRVDCESSNGLTENLTFLAEKKEEFAQQPLIPPRLLTGRDLMAAGWKPGPQLGKMLESVQNQQLEGSVTTSEQALEWVRQEFGAPNALD